MSNFPERDEIASKCVHSRATEPERGREKEGFSQCHGLLASPPPPSLSLSPIFGVVKPANWRAGSEGGPIDTTPFSGSATGTEKGVRSVDCVQEQKREEGRIKVIDCADSGKVSGYTR